MKRKTHPKLNLTNAERKKLRTNKIKIAEVIDYAPDELASILDVSEIRAREIFALADFQKIPSVGIEFANDLLFLGYFCVEDLTGLDGALLLDQYEKKKGFKTDPCVEDQFRLVTYVATTNNYSKQWWDFTSERKKYRSTAGYPKDRPVKCWTENLNKQIK